MGFSLFSKDKSDNQSKAKASIFGKLRNSVTSGSTQNKTLSHNFDNNEPNFGKAPLSSFENPHDVNNYQTDNFNDIGEQVQSENPPINSEKSLSQTTSFENKIKDNGDLPQEDVQNNYYTYHGDESYLDEAGRNADHLYIGPGEPLTPKKPKPLFEKLRQQVSEAQASQNALNNETSSADKAFVTQNTIIKTTNYDKDILVTENNITPTSQGLNESKSNTIQPDYLSNQSYEDNDDEPLYITPGAPLQEKKRKKEQPVSEGPIYITPGFKGTTSLNNGKVSITPASQSEQKNEPIVDEQEQKTATINEANVSDKETSNVKQEFETKSATIESEPQVNVQNNSQNPAPITVDKAAIFANVKQNDISNNSQNAVINGDGKISALMNTLLFIRQLFAAFFNYTNLGVIFQGSALTWIGPSKPGFMPVPFFVIGFICSSFSILLNQLTRPSLCAHLVLITYLIFTGCNGFRGFGKLLSAFSQRKIDGYTQALIVLIIAAIFTTTFQYFVTEMNVDFSFSLGFGVLVMLSALCASSINYGSNDDPVSSYGSLGLKGLVSSIIICIAVTFVVLDWQIAISMVGIVFLTRLVIGQFMYVKGISASCDIVCSIQLISMILLMLDLLLFGNSVSFTNAFLNN